MKISGRYPMKFRHRPITGLAVAVLAAFMLVVWYRQLDLFSHHADPRVQVVVGIWALAFLLGIPLDCLRKWFLLSEYSFDGEEIQEINPLTKRRKLIRLTDVQAIRPVKYGRNQGYLLIAKDRTKICVIDALGFWSDLVPRVQATAISKRPVWLLG